MLTTRNGWLSFESGSSCNRRMRRCLSFYLHFDPGKFSFREYGFLRSIYVFAYVPCRRDCSCLVFDRLFCGGRRYLHASQVCKPDFRRAGRLQAHHSRHGFGGQAVQYLLEPLQVYQRVLLSGSAYGRSEQQPRPAFWRKPQLHGGPDGHARDGAYDGHRHDPGILGCM